MNKRQTRQLVWASIALVVVMLVVIAGSVATCPM
jgi:hypothetical protein